MMNTCARAARVTCRWALLSESMGAAAPRQAGTTSRPPPLQSQRSRHLATAALQSRLTRPSRKLDTKATQWQSIRHSSGGSTFFGRLNALRRTNPIAVPAAVACAAAACTLLLVVSYIYISSFVPIDTTYPEPVAKKLKRALYYSNQDVQPQKAWDYYKQALQAAEETGMHPFSDEVLGIKFTAAGMLERTNHFREAIYLLDVLRKDCLRFVDWCEGQEKEGSSADLDTRVEDPEAPHDAGRDLRKSRTRVLGKTVGLCVKLGELNTNPYVEDLPAAEKFLIEGVELALKEQQRRAVNSVSAEKEGEWLSSDELGATLASLADHYESISKHSLASPLYLRAITLAQPPSCHTAVLMNNLAASLSQSLPDDAIQINSTIGNSYPPSSRSTLISNARSWVEKSLQICQSLQPPDRTEECDLACAVATHNLGEFAEMENLVDEARRKYEEARILAKAIGYEEGVNNADEGIARLARRTS